MAVTMPRVQKISREGSAKSGEPSETTRRTPQWNQWQHIALAYLNGALGDASRGKGNRIRYTQKYPQWLSVLKSKLAELGSASWIYKEGKQRSVFALETCCTSLDFACDGERLETRDERIAYLRGFFDAEGGVPHRASSKFYIQLVQKNRKKIETLARMLASLDVKTGALHNPSVRVDPNYWRIFVSTESHRAFARIIGSWHPVKGPILLTRMKI
jgi:intein/homing endonuclease